MSYTEMYDMLDCDKHEVFDIYELMSKWKKEHTEEECIKANELGLFPYGKFEDVNDEMLKIADWLKKYKELHSEERLVIYNVLDKSGQYTKGTILLVNGQNGSTRFTSQSLKHVYDIASYLEDHYGARVIINATGYHSDVYYYSLYFIIFNDDDIRNLSRLKWNN